MLKSVTHGYAMGNKKTVQGKFQLGKRHISQLFQLFNGRSGVLLFSR